MALDAIHLLQKLLETIAGGSVGLIVGALLVWGIAFVAEPPVFLTLTATGAVGVAYGYRFGHRVTRGLLRAIHHPNL